MKAGVGETKERVRREVIVAWVVVALLVAIMFARVVVAIRAIGDRPPTWQYRVAPMTPAESPSSTQPASSSTKAPKQVELAKPVVGKRAK